MLTNSFTDTKATASSELEAAIAKIGGWKIASGSRGSRQDLPPRDSGSEDSRADALEGDV